MSDHDEVPSLTPEAKAFLDQHATTGEPSAEALARVRERVLSPGRPAPATPAPLPEKRSWWPHEVMAAAAVLLFLVGAQGLYLYFRTPAQSAEVKAVVEAYRAGDVEGAHRMASQSCSDAACKPLASSLSQALGLSKRLESLSPRELGQLAALDAQLAEGSDTALGLRIAQRRQGLPLQPPPGEVLATAEQLFKEGSEEKRARNFEQAVLRLEKCIQIDPGYHACYRLLGSVYASIASRDQSASDMEKARHSYQRFLEVAPPDDEYVPKVQAILDQARGNSAPPAPIAGNDAVLSLNRPAPTSADPTSTALTLFQNGDLPGALAAVGACPNTACRALEANLRDYDTRSQHPESLDEAEILSLYALHQKLSGSTWSERDRPLRTQLVSKLFIKASQAQTTGNWTRAVELANQVLRMDPQHLGALALLEEGRNQAREVYLRGYQIRDQSPTDAIRLFKQVMAMTPPSDETHQKARLRVMEAELGQMDGVVVIPLHGSKDLVLAQNIQRVAVGDPDVADVQVLGPRKLGLKGMGEGKTTLLVWLTNGQRESRLLDVR